MSGTPPLAPWVAPVGVIDDFLPLELAARMREDIEAHFAAPDAHGHTHQAWNYWFVPELSTYLRTASEKIIRRDRVDAFIRALQAWSIVTLGMGNVTWPSLCLYVGGCRKALHNEAADGRFGFVYSLTRDQRRTIGGETLVFAKALVLTTTWRTPRRGVAFTMSSSRSSTGSLCSTTGFLMTLSASMARWTRSKGGSSYTVI